MTERFLMTNASDHNQRARAIFMQALEQESTELRAQFIDDACAGDQELRTEVGELIASLQKAGSFMERKPAADIEQTFV
jgi:hypothetical protein